MESINWSLNFDPSFPSKDMTDVGCIWFDYLINLVDLERLSLGMVSLMGSNLPICLFGEVVDELAFILFDHLNLLDLEGLPMGM